MAYGSVRTKTKEEYVRDVCEMQATSSRWYDISLSGGA